MKLYSVTVCWGNTHQIVSRVYAENQQQAAQKMLASLQPNYPEAKDMTVTQVREVNDYGNAGASAATAGVYSNR